MRIALSSYGASLISRMRGGEIRDDILSRRGKDVVLELDFDGVRRASYSFIDELVGDLATRRERGELKLDLSIWNIDGIEAFHVEQSLSRRLGDGFHEKVRLAVLA